MGLLRLLALAAVLALGSGCFVFDELDKKKPQASGGGGAEEGAPEAPPTYQQAVSSWFEGARTLSKSPGEAEDADPMVSCRHGGRTFFARRSDCLARGGEAG